MKQLTAILLALMLAGCQTGPNLIREKPVLVAIPQELYKCPLVTKWPNPQTLTDVQVAKLLVLLQRHNLTCHSSMEAIKKFQDEAQKIIDRDLPGTKNRITRFLPGK
jgi:hypothetical protein